jgi:tetratricopeptide (TPR) repeat protein
MQTNLKWVAVWMALAIATPAPAQIDEASRSKWIGAENGMPISGRVHSSDKLELSLLQIQLHDPATGRIIAASQIRTDGSFQFPIVPIGFYELRIVTPGSGIRLSKEIHTGSPAFLDLQLTEKISPATNKPISAARLAHTTPAKAQKQIQAATKAFEKGDRSKAIEYLLNAVAIDPQNFDAISNLGALQLQERQPDKALPWLLKAKDIDALDAANNLNLSAYYAFIDDYSKAESYAAASLRTDPNSAKAHYLLAFALVRQGKNLDYAKSHLSGIQNDFAPAKLLLNSLNPKQ